MAELSTYRRKRDPRRTPEPVPAGGPLPSGDDDVFVVQEHHARALHWDFRLERDGVLVSWALPKGLPLDPGQDHLAKPTEDHPLEYADFAGDIPKGQYGGGRVTIWDRGRYECEEWTEDKVKVVLHGSRVEGRYALLRTGRGAWMIHRMSPPPRKDWLPVPELIQPMLASTGAMPTDDSAWSFEMKWDGVRAVLYVDGGRARAMTRNDRDVVGSYPELRDLAAELGSTQCVLDGEIVALDPAGRPSFGMLQQRMHVTKPAQVARLREEVPVSYFAFDLLHLDGRSLLDRPYVERRELLEELGLAGPSWTVPPAFPGPGSDVLAAARERGLEGVVAKRHDAPYSPGKRSGAWVKVKLEQMQEVVVIGWKPGEGRRAGTIGSLLLGVHDADGRLVYAGHVGTGFTDRMLVDLGERLAKLSADASPTADEVPRMHARHAQWVKPRLVGEVVFTEWTRDGRLRHPAWRGLRPDKRAKDVVREPQQ